MVVAYGTDGINYDLGVEGNDLLAMLQSIFKHNEEGPDKRFNLNPVLNSQVDTIAFQSTDWRLCRLFVKY